MPDDHQYARGVDQDTDAGRRARRGASQERLLHISRRYMTNHMKQINFWLSAIIWCSALISYFHNPVLSLVVELPYHISTNK